MEIDLYLRRGGFLEGPVYLDPPREEFLAVHARYSIFGFLPFLVL